MTDHLEALRVDHEAAIEKLAWGSLQGPWQIPTEAVRLARAAGADEIRIRWDERTLHLEAPAAKLPRRTLADLVTLLDPDVEADVRHEALAAVQDDEGSALAAALCRRGTTMQLQLGGEGGLQLERDAEGNIRAPRVAEETLERPGLRLVLGRLDLDLRRAEHWLRRSARWCDASILLEGRPLARGFPDALLEGRLEAANLPVRLALTRRSGPPRLWLLRHGILAATATVTDFPGFEATLELGAVSQADDPPSALREIAGRELAPVLDGAVDLALLGSRKESRSEELRRAISRFLLEVAAGHRRVAEISSAPMLRLAENGELRPTTLDELARRVRITPEGTCTLETVDPDVGLSHLTRPTLVAEAWERSLVAQVLGVSTVAPPLPVRAAWGPRLFAALRDLRDHVASIGRREVRTNALSPPEKAFLEAMADGATEAPSLAFRSGGGRPLHFGGRVLLGRDNPMVRQAVRALADDPSWAYPAWLALLGDREPAPNELRRAWLAAEARKREVVASTGS